MRSEAARLPCSALLSACLLSWSSAVHAQTIRDAVRDHVGEGLERKQPESKAKPKPRPRESARPRLRPARRPAATVEQSVQDLPAEAPVPEAYPLPRRVFGRNFELDPKLGFGMRGWYPDQYPFVSIAHASYYTWSLELKAKLFRYVRLHRGYYESNGLKGPRTQGAAIAQDVGQLVPKAAWLLGTFGVPLSRRWETMVSYETRSFVTRAKPDAPVAIVPRNTPPDSDLSQLPRSAAPLEFVSGFETLVLGIRYFPDQGNAGLVGDPASRWPPMYFGVGFTQYTKPYQVRVGSDALDELLFDGRFRGLGLAYGLSTARKVARPYLDLDAQLGLGQVSLLEDLTLNELLPEDWLIGYLQGDVTLGYILPLLNSRPTPLLTGELSVGGATFFYFELKEGDGGEAPSLPLNWDLFWAVQVSLALPL